MYVSQRRCIIKVCDVHQLLLLIQIMLKHCWINSYFFVAMFTCLLLTVFHHCCNALTDSKVYILLTFKTKDCKSFISEVVAGSFFLNMTRA